MTAGSDDVRPGPAVQNEACQPPAMATFPTVIRYFCHILDQDRGRNNRAESVALFTTAGLRHHCIRPAAGSQLPVAHRLIVPRPARATRHFALEITVAYVSWEFFAQSSTTTCCGR